MGSAADVGATLATAFIPRLVSEREPDGSWEDCTWATGVMFANCVEGRDVHPPTRAEYEALRVDGGESDAEGDGDGSNYGQLRAGLAKRYGITVDTVAHVREIPIGAGAAVQGRVAELPKSLWVTTFRGSHSVFTIRLDEGSFLWFDPLKPKDSTPVRASLQVVEDFFDGLPGAEILVGFTGQEKWGDRMIRIDFNRYRTTADTPVFESPGADAPKVTIIPAGKQVTSIGIPMDRTTTDSTPFLNAAWRAVLISSGALDSSPGLKVGYVKTASVTPVPTSPLWDEALGRALTDPDFRGEKVVEKVVDNPVTVSNLRAALKREVDVAAVLSAQAKVLNPALPA